MKHSLFSVICHPLPKSTNSLMSLEYTTNVCKHLEKTGKLKTSFITNNEWAVRAGRQ